MKTVSNELLPFSIETITEFINLNSGNSSLSASHTYINMYIFTVQPCRRQIEVVTVIQTTAAFAVKSSIVLKCITEKLD